MFEDNAQRFHSVMAAIAYILPNVTILQTWPPGPGKAGIVQTETAEQAERFANALIAEGITASFASRGATHLVLVG